MNKTERQHCEKLDRKEQSGVYKQPTRMMRKCERPLSWRALAMFGVMVLAVRSDSSSPPRKQFAFRGRDGPPARSDAKGKCLLVNILITIIPPSNFVSTQYLSVDGLAQPIHIFGQWMWWWYVVVDVVVVVGGC